MDATRLASIPLARAHAAAVNQDGSVPFSSFPALTVDTLLGASRTDVTDDGVLLVGGSADPAKGAVALTVAMAPLNPGGDPRVLGFSVQPDALHRWPLFFDNNGAGAPDGNDVVAATQGTNGATVTSRLCIR